MARLNEPPVALAASAKPIATAVENIDILKRRFIRQNRELARNNSNQSLRIRSLELDAARLTSENQDLRCRIIELENKLLNAQSCRSISAVDELSRTLEDKIDDLKELIRGIGAVKQKPSVAVDIKSVLSPSRRQYRERQPLSEVMRESQMPTIMEDRRSSRPSLEEHIRTRLSLQSTSSGSPEIGPPPVARLDYGTDTNIPPQESETSPKALTEDFLRDNLSINLENRRRRRESLAQTEVRRHSILAQSPVKGVEEANTMLRTGAKRKLADREIDKTSRPISPTAFTFHRKASLAQPDVAEETDAVKVDPSIDNVRTQSPDLKPRKVLGDKSTNVSPRKQVETGHEKSQRADLPGVTRSRGTKTTPLERNTVRPRRASAVMSIPKEPAHIPATVDVVLDDHLELPTVGALETMLSPTISDKSPWSTEPCHTPPPMGLSSLRTTESANARPSRRARSAVNYAEPSLIAKMRRPDASMADAVAGLRAASESLVVKQKDSTASAPSTDKELPNVGDQQLVISSWRERSLASREPQSPLVGKSEEANPSHGNLIADSKDIDMKDELTIRRQRRESGTLLTRFSNPISTTHSSIPSPSAEVRKLEELDLYDFKDSSPPSSPQQATRNSSFGSATSGRAVTSSTTSSRRASTSTASSDVASGHRRHSSLTKDSVKAAGKSGAMTVKLTDVSGGGAELKAAREDRIMSRRRSMML